MDLPPRKSDSNALQSPAGASLISPSLIDCFLSEELARKIDAITQNLGGYVKKIFKNMASINPGNGTTLYDFLAAQQNELNIRDSTKEGIIKKIVWLSAHLNHKPFTETTKEDILDYLNSRTTADKWYFQLFSGGCTILMKLTAEKE